MKFKNFEELAVFIMLGAVVFASQSTNEKSIIVCKGTETSVASYECRQQQVISPACYYDGYTQSWKSCGSICNGALYIGTRGRRCRDYCKDYMRTACSVKEPGTATATFSQTTLSQQLKQHNDDRHPSTTVPFNPTNGILGDGHEKYLAALIGLVCLVVIMSVSTVVCCCRKAVKGTDGVVWKKLEQSA